MKRIPLTRVSGNDPLVQGIDNALAIALLFGVGYGLDRWLGTSPWMMIVFVVLGGIGVFAKMKYRYDAQMERYEAQRRELNQRATEEQVSR